MKMKQADDMIEDNLIVKHLSGSHAYGMSTPESDVDNRGIFYSEKINIITPLFPMKPEGDPPVELRRETEHGTRGQVIS